MEGPILFVRMCVETSMWVCFTVYLCLYICMCVPEKSLAPLTSHGVEVEACGFVTAYATNPWHVPIELIRGQAGGTYNSGLHH